MDGISNQDFKLRITYKGILSKEVVISAKDVEIENLHESEFDVKLKSLKRVDSANKINYLRKI